MVTTSKTSGSINIIDCEDGGFTIVLDNYVGTIQPDSSTSQLKFHLYGNSTITNDITLTNHNNLDRIDVKGAGSCNFKHLQATCIEIESTTITTTGLTANVIWLTGSVVASASRQSQHFIEVSGHIWVTDTYLTDSRFTYSITSPFLLIENSTMILRASTQAIHIDNELIIEHSDIETNTGTQFRCKAINVDSRGYPKYFTQLVKSTGDGIELITRRKLYGYTPAVPVNAFDMFKEATGYTDVNLHRRINQDGVILKKGIDLNAITSRVVQMIIDGIFNFNGIVQVDAIVDDVILAICNDPQYEILDDDDVYAMLPEVVQAIIDGTYVPPKTNNFSLDETSSRKYELGIYGLKSYRTTDIKFREEDEYVVDQMP